MDKINFEGLQPEIFYAQPWFSDFMEIYAQVLDDRIRYPIYQLETIRDVTSQTDTYVVMQTLKQIGFDLPTDFIRHNINRLSQSIPQLVLYAETSGTNNYAKTMSFIFGRSVDAKPLYTEDYTNFYTEAYGPLQVDGGEWYKTTHVELGMQMLSSDFNLLLPRGKTIKDRFLEAFYEFAPWNVVVERFHFNVDIQIPLYITGRIVKQPKRYLDVGVGDLKVTDMKIVGPSEVYEASRHEYELYVTLENGGGSSVETIPRLPLIGTAPFGATEATIKTFRELTTANQIVSLDIPDGEFGYICYPKSMGLSTFTDTSISIPGGWDGASWSYDDIGEGRGPVEIQRTIGDTTSTWYLYRTDFDSLGQVEYEIEFEHPNIEEHDTITTSSGDTYVSQTVRVLGQWSSNKTGLIDWQGSFAQFGNLGLNMDATIYAEYQGRSTAKNIKILNNTSNIRSIEIVGPDSVRAMESETYTVVAHTESGDETLDVVISTRSVYGYMEGNLLHVYQIDEDSPIYLHASYELPDGQVLTAIRRIEAIYVDPEIHLVGLEIDGPDSFYENEAKQYTCIAHYSDGSHRGVLAVWNSGCGGVYITPSGELYSSTTESDLPLTLRATHQYKDVVMTAELPVVFKRRTITIVHTEILGPSTVIEQTQTQYSTVARFSDGSTGVVEAEWSSDRFFINDRGILETGSVGSTPVALTIRSRIEGRLAIKQITAVNTPVTLDNLLVSGPDDLREDATGKFTAYAHYSNGRDVEITPEWSIRDNPSWASVDDNGLLSFNEPRDGIIEVTATYRVAGRVLTQTKPVVLVPKTRLISGLLISGPNEVFDGERIVLTGTALYNDGHIESVSPVWSVTSADPLNDPEAMADIVSPGVLQGRSVEENTKVIAIARYFKEIAEFEITVKPRIINSPDKPVSSRIIGPAAFYSDQRGSYSHMILFEECAAELAVSSDWEIDVSSDIATIDSAGFLWSVNGRSATVTVTSTYTCGTYTVVDSYLVNILGQADVLKELVIAGPDAVIGENLTLYTAELFKTGEVVEDGKGTAVAPEWSIVNNDGRVAVNGSGQVYVVDASQSFKFILKAVYQEGFEKVEATKEINVIRNARPILGVGPIGIRNDPEIGQYLTTELPSLESGQRFTLTAGAGQYMYFCYPASLGLAEFIDVNSQFVGGWDGASWPDDGSVGDLYGPIAIQRANELGISSTWYLYRTDFDGIGTFTYEVTFGH